jgi:hypothetical protein
MSGVGTVAATTIGISAAAPATFDAAGYAALTFTNIGNIDNAGSDGRVYNEVTFNPIATRGTRKFKGSFNEGNKTLTLAYDSADGGAQLLKTALNDDGDYSFEVALPDGGFRYFQAKVMSFVNEEATVDDIRMATVELAITTNDAGVGIIEVLAT